MKENYKNSTRYTNVITLECNFECNKTSTELQHPKYDKIKAINLIKSLKFYVFSLRDSNTSYKEKITNPSSEIFFSDSKQRIKQKNSLMVRKLKKY